MRTNFNKLLLFIILIISFISLTSCKTDRYAFANFEFDGYLDTSSWVAIEYDTKKITYDGVKRDVYNVIKDILQQTEDSFSPTNSLTEAVNEKAGVEYVEVSRFFLDLLQANIEMAKVYETFDPTIGSLTTLWDISNQTEYCLTNHNCVKPSDEDINIAKELVDYNNILIDGTKVKLKEVGMKLDFGASAKGYAADLIKEALINMGYYFFVINLGGNVYIYGDSIIYNQSKTVQSVSIENPFKEEDIVVDVRVDDSSVVTSSVAKRYIKVDNVKYNHILDINTGYPIDNDIEQITVIDASSTKADMLSTALMGFSSSEAVMDYMINNNIKGVVITTKGVVYVVGDVRYIRVANTLVHERK